MHIHFVARRFSRTFIGALLAALAMGGVSWRLQAAEVAQSQSALETDPQGWADILPPADLQGWYRVPVPPTGKLGREQWHVDADRKVLVCDGDGGHDMLLTEKEYGDAVFHFEFRYTKVEGKTGYNSGAYVRNSKDGAIWHQAQFGDAKDGFLFGQTPALCVLGAVSFAADKPNILYVLCDDLGYGDLGCYGATRVKTPNLDRLASQGCRFTDAHSTASVCTPTRYAFLTGRYAWRQPGTGIAAGNAPALIPSGTMTVASLLKSAGYRTGLVGKWHLGLGEEPKTEFNGDIKPGPLELGFDYAFFIPATGDRVPCVLVENHRVVGYDPADPIRVSYGAKIGDEPTGKDPGVALKIQGGPGHLDTVVNGIPRIGFMTGGHAARWVDEDIADTLAAKAVKFIESNQSGPFFLFLAPHDIHEPMVPHPRFRGTSDCGWRGDVIHQLDWTVGEVLAALDRLKLASNTLVLFTSDNGGAIKNTYDDGTNPLHARQPPNGTLRGSKGSLYEGGHRVPFLARWPGRIASGSTSGQLIGHVDTLATFAALTGQKLPPDAAPDSFNVLPAWLGEILSQPMRDHLVLQNNGQAPLALRQGDWVLIGKGGGGQPQRRAAPTAGAPKPAYELFNLAADPAQTNNLAAQETDRVNAMAARLETVRRQGHSRPQAQSTPGGE